MKSLITISIEMDHNPYLMDAIEWIDAHNLLDNERLHLKHDEANTYVMVTKHAKEQFFFLSNLDSLDGVVEEETIHPNWKVYREIEHAELRYEVYYLVKEDQYYCCSIQRQFPVTCIEVQGLILK